MSAYKVIQTEFRNLDSLKKALADVGFDQVEQADARTNSLPLAGYGGSRGEDVCLRIPRHNFGGYEDTGFAWEPSTQSYRAIISTHDGFGSFGEGTLTRVRQRYALHEVRRQARSKGYNVQEQPQADGSIRMTLVRR